MKRATNFITSIKDPVVVQARSLTTAKGRLSSHKCLLEGIEHIEWALATGMVIEYVLFDGNELESPLIKKLQEQPIVCYSTSEGILKKVSETSYLVPFIGVAQLLPEAPLDNTQEPFIVVLDRLKDHGNIGTIVRSAHAFNIKHLILTEQTTDLFYKKMIDASRGKVFGTHVNYFDSSLAALHALKQAGYDIVSTSPYGKTVQSIAQIRNKPIALFVGNETEGVSDEVLRNSDYIIQIPMSKDVESLNVAVAAGISIYELKMKMVFAMLQEKIKSSLGRNMNVAAKLIQSAYEAQTKKLTNFSSIQIILLMILKCDQFMTYEQAGKDTATFGPELQSLLEPLFAEALIQKTNKNGIDGIELTYKGEDFLAKVWFLHEKQEHAILADFSDDEKKLLNDFLVRIQHNCQKLILQENEPDGIQNR